MNDDVKVALESIRDGGTGIAQALADRLTDLSGRSVDELELSDLSHGLALLLSAGWQLAQLADPNLDGLRTSRYAELLRRHADAIEGNPTAVH